MRPPRERSERKRALRLALRLVRVLLAAAPLGQRFHETDLAALEHAATAAEACQCIEAVRVLGKHHWVFEVLDVPGTASPVTVSGQSGTAFDKVQERETSRIEEALQGIAENLTRMQEAVHEGDRLVLELNEQLVTSFDGPVRSNLTTLLHEMHWSEHVFWDCVGSLEKFVRQLAMEVTRRRYLGEGLCRACYGYRVPLEWVQAMGVQPPQDASKNAEPAPTAEGLASAHWRTMPLSPQQVLQAWAYPDASVSDGVRRGWRLQYRYWNNIGWLEWIDELRVLDNALQQTHAKLTCNQTQQTHRNLI
jgi:hypothetical protein